VSIIVGGLFMITADELPAMIKMALEKEQVKDSTTTLSYILNSFSFNFSLFLLVTFMAYFTGHLLYRQSPKRPDYASFLRIRDRVMKKNAGAWVIEKGHGVKTSEVQFPYANLKNYLSERGFGYLAKYVGWDNESERKAKNQNTRPGEAKKNTGNRSKTIINRAKIRLAFFFPDQMVNLIRNEAHIRLASSMWYASKYIIKLSYICLPIILFDLNIERWLKHDFSLKMLACSLVLFVCCLIGKRFKLVAVRTMRDFDSRKIPADRRIGRLVRIRSAIAGFLNRMWGNEHETPASIETDEEESPEEIYARTEAKKVDFGWEVHDHMPLGIWGILFVSYYYGLFDTPRRDFMILYLGIVTFIMIGVLFSKRYIEQTIHYQRVRELVYVLETAYVAQVRGNRKLPNPLKFERVAYEIGLTVKDAAARQVDKSPRL
jgi:hypothetical protein